MEKQTDEQLELIREIIAVFFSFGHDTSLFQRKFVEIVGIDSLKEKNIIPIGEQGLGESERLELQEKGLTDREIEFYCLANMKFSAEEIAVIMGLKNIRSVYVKQSRINKKLRGAITPELALVMLGLSIIAYLFLSLFANWH